MTLPTPTFPEKLAEKIVASRHYAATKIFPYLSDMVMEGVIWNDAAVPTMAVSKQGNIRTSEAFVERCSVAALATVIFHEHMHVYLRHFRGNELITGGVCTAFEWNMAGDYSVNSLLDDHKATEWPEGIRPLLPQDKGWKKGLTAEEYLQKILQEKEADAAKQAQDEAIKKAIEEACEQPPESGDSEPQPEGDEQGPSSDQGASPEAGDSGEGEGEGEGEAQGTGADQSPSAAADGANGSGNGSGPGQPVDNMPQNAAPLPGEEPDADGTGEPVAGESAPGAGEGECGAGAGGPETEADKYVDEESAKTDATTENMRRKASEKIAEEVARQEGGGGAGDAVPTMLRRHAEQMLKPPAVQWKTVLRRAVRKSEKGSRGARRRTVTRVHRRQGGIGYGAGKPLLKGVRKHSPKVLVGVDTSASMGSACLEQAVSEVAAILKYVGKGVTFASWDTDLKAAAKVRSPKEVLKNLVGGGGTDFKELFRWVDTEAPDLFVFITDGWGEAPAQEPSTPTLFVSVGAGSRKPYSRGRQDVAWGEHVTITPEGTLA